MSDVSDAPARSTMPVEISASPTGLLPQKIGAVETSAAGREHSEM